MRAVADGIVRKSNKKETTKKWIKNMLLTKKTDKGSTKNLLLESIVAKNTFNRNRTTVYIS